MKKVISIVLLLLTILTSCSNSGNHKVQSYREKKYHSDGTWEWVYWYMMYGGGNNYYYYSSPTPVSSFSSIAWSQSNTNPITGSNFEQTETISVSNQELSPEMQSEVSESNGFEGSANDVTGNESNGFEGSANDVTGNESGGFSDAGGGDSGGGDGGGGGGE
jgi:hypothetical protein